MRLLVVCNRYDDRDCGSQGTDLNPAILVKCNRSDTRDFINFMVSELVATYGCTLLIEIIMRSRYHLTVLANQHISSI